MNTRTTAIHKLLATMWQQQYRRRLQSLPPAPPVSLAGQFRGELYRRSQVTKYARMFRREIEARRVVARYQRTAVKTLCSKPKGRK